MNQGTIASTRALPPTNTGCDNGFTCASGTVTVGGNTVAGGLVGYNEGFIVNAFATGAVTGTVSGSGFGSDLSANLGGLIGTNAGQITNVYASGNVGGLNVSGLNVGGLVADNQGTI